MARAPRPPYDVANIVRAQRLLLSGVRTAAAQPRPAALPPSIVQQGLRVLARRWLWGLIACSLVVVSTFLWGLVSSEQYLAEGSLVLTQSVTGSSGIDNLLSWRVYFSNTALARLGRLPETHLRAVDLLAAWLQDAEVRPANLAAATLDDETSQLLASLRPASLAGLVHVTPDTENVAVDVQAWHRDPALALFAAQAVLSALHEEVIENELFVLDVTELSSQARRTQQELAAVEADVKTLYGGATEQGLMPRDLMDLLLGLEDANEKIEATELEKAEVQQRIETLRRILASPEGAAGTVPTPPFLLQQLISQELLLEDYHKRYTVEHPKVKKLNREIDSLRSTIERIRGEPGNYGIAEERAGSWRDQNLAISLGSLEAHLASLDVRLKSLGERRDALESYFLEAGGSATMVRLRELEHRRNALHDFLRDLNLRIEQMRYLAARVRQKDATFTKVKPVDVRVRAVTPPKTAIYVISFLVGLVAAALVMLQIEAMDNTVHDIERVVAAGNLEVLGTIGFHAKDPFIYPENPKTPTANVFALLRNHVRFSGPDNPERLLAVTSARSGEGKSYVAANLAISFAQEGNRVALVDTDLRRVGPKVYREALTVSPEAEALGLSQFLEAEDVAVEHILRPTEMENLWLIAAGGVARNPPRALRSPRLAELLDDLQQRFDVILLDCSPVLRVVDSSLVAERARATMLVCGWAQTHYRDIEEAAKRLRTVHANLVGIIINRAPFSTRDYGGYYAEHG